MYFVYLTKFMFFQLLCSFFLLILYPEQVLIGCSCIVCLVLTVEIFCSVSFKQLSRPNSFTLGTILFSKWIRHAIYPCAVHHAWIFYHHDLLVFLIESPGRYGIFRPLWWHIFHGGSNKGRTSLSLISALFLFLPGSSIFIQGVLF